MDGVCVIPKARKRRELPDLEKVMAGLRVCASGPKLSADCETGDCPYERNEVRCIVELLGDTLMLMEHFQSVMHPRELDPRHSFPKPGQIFLLWRGVTEKDPFICVAQCKSYKGENGGQTFIRFVTCDGWRELDPEEYEDCLWLPQPELI